MSENIEIKAKLNNFDVVYNIIKKLTRTNPTLLIQQDIYYRVPSGRLKLRSICDDYHEIIFYNRPNQAGPKNSEYYRYQVEQKDDVDLFFKRIFGQLVIVNKHRNLFLQNNIRFHLDDVDNLGQFLEIEYVLSPNESRREAFNKVNELINQLHIDRNSFVVCSYADLLLEKL